MNEKELYKDIISTFGKSAFEKFCTIALERKNGPTTHFDTIKEVGQNIFEIGYYDYTNPYPHNGKEVYFLNYLPIHILQKLNSNNLDLSLLINNIKQYLLLDHNDVDFLDEYYPLINMGIISNISHVTKDYFFNNIAPLFSKAFRLSKLKLKPNFSLELGTIDSLIDAKTLSQLKNDLGVFYNTYKDGISIHFDCNGFSANEFTICREIASGGTIKTFSPLETITSPLTKNKILIEFEKLLNSNVKESVLEDFLSTYYKIFFPLNDRIITQLWLRFPELDISRKNRRIDLFMRNAVTNDWDLYELKKANASLVKGTDIPSFRNKVLDSIMQLKTYEKLLSQNNIKQKLAEEGIEYAEPSFCLIIGRDPKLEHNQWRWLQSQLAQKNLKIKTYDDILREAKVISQNLNSIEVSL